MKVDLNEIKAGLAAIKGTKWIRDDENGIVWSDEANVVITFTGNEEEANLTLIANAPEWLASLVEQVEQMKQQYADEINKKGNELDRAYFQGLKLRIQVEGMQSLINHIEQITSDGLTRNEIMNYKRLKGASHDPK